MKNIIFILLLLTGGVSVQAQEVSDMKKLNQLVLIRDNIEMIDKLIVRGVLDSNGTEIKEQLSLAEKIIGKEPVTYAELVSITGGSSPPPTAWEKFIGFFTFVNILMVLAAIMLIVALMWLFGIYLVALVFLVNLKSWELISYAACIALIVIGANVRSDMSMIWVLPGCFGLIGGLTLNRHNWWACGDYWRDCDLENRFIQFSSFVLMITWGAIAIYFQSQLIGFLSIGAMMVFLGFYLMVIPGYVYLGFTDDGIARATFTAFCVGFLYTFLYATGQTSDILTIFEIGLSGWGYFVFYLGILIMSSKWYWWQGKGYKWGEWVIMQLLVIVAGVAALYCGSIYNIDLLLGIGGTFFGLYLIEKWFEIPWKNSGWAWSLLGLSILLYCFISLVQLYPEYFLFVAN